MNFISQHWLLRINKIFLMEQTQHYCCSFRIHAVNLWANYSVHYLNQTVYLLGSAYIVINRIIWSETTNLQQSNVWPGYVWIFTDKPDLKADLRISLIQRLVTGLQLPLSSSSAVQPGFYLGWHFCYHVLYCIWLYSTNKDPEDPKYKTVFHVLFFDITMAICNVWQQIWSTELYTE